ncbi:MAG: VWA domain-containing protein [Lamprobacter sp.]|uniref:VWA domain-containing protein n=1 Tax=Lamprobacter sp. TaxID=3100796 RepID=UPI002B2577AA|nr:VWA domain-containing protein [Lamprobacter sp.]MEA3641728.1 VWA domain-containing protein [Lamprobacter sp.]
MQLKKGQRVALPELVSSMKFEVGIDLQGIVIDVSCFGVDASVRLSDERYMTFFNQPRTPCGGVQLTSPASFGTGFKLALDQLPLAIDRLIFVAAVDGAGTMRQLTSGRLCLIEQGQIKATIALHSSDFADERALMLAEVYRKSGIWRLSATGQGFNGGLDALVRHFGGEIAEDECSQPPVMPPPKQESAHLSLEKRVEKQAPQLVNLVKTARLSLEKQGLQGLCARVGLVLDVSGSMYHQYDNGRVQELLDRVLPLALHFDDDGSLDVWAFADRSRRLDCAVLGNIRAYINTIHGGWRQWNVGGGNNEPCVIQEVINEYRRDPQAPPAYVLFVSDGGIYQNQEITRLMREGARYPIFWQFMGIGGRNYGVLEQLDTMTGRIVDNCGFFAIDDLRNLTESQLYDRLLQEFPDWLRAAQSKGVIHQ